MYLTPHLVGEVNKQESAMSDNVNETTQNTIAGVIFSTNSNIMQYFFISKSRFWFFRLQKNNCATQDAFDSIR